MTRLSFLQRYEAQLRKKVRETNVSIAHSKQEDDKMDVQGILDALVSIQGHRYKSNLIVGDYRYDIILGVP